MFPTWEAAHENIRHEYRELVLVCLGRLAEIGPSKEMLFIVGQAADFHSPPGANRALVFTAMLRALTEKGEG